MEAYAIHDKDGHLEFLLGMWLHTWNIAGPPTEHEATVTLADWSPARRARLFGTIQAAGMLKLLETVNGASTAP
jgi:hypothetical protein